MKADKLLKTLALLVIAAVALSPLPALADGMMKRTELQRVDLTGVPGTEVITATIVAEPGSKIPRHSHPGDEFLYVIEGGMIQVPGKEPVEMKTGQAVHFPRGLVHGGFTVVGEKTIKAVTVHVVDKGKPLVIPAE